MERLRGMAKDKTTAKLMADRKVLMELKKESVMAVQWELLSENSWVSVRDK
jgi:predicted secreted protein